MDSEAIFSQIPQILRKYWIVIGLGLVGLILFVYGLISLFTSANPSGSKFSQDNSASNSSAQAVKEENLINVDVEGAVVKPGVYKLNFSSIIQDALVSAGGLSGDADRSFVSKNINLASKLTDGAKIYIPKIGEVANLNNQSNVLGIKEESGLININTASSESLDTLPGVGSVTAAKIINSRPYGTIDELLSKKVVSSSVFTKIKDKITAF